MPKHFPLSGRTLGLLALAAWLALPWAWWASRHPVPRASTYLGIRAVRFSSAEPIDDGVPLLEEYGDQGKSLVYWELATGKKRAEVPFENLSPQLRVNGGWPAYALLPDGTLLLAIVDKSGVRVHDLDANQDVGRISKDMSNVYRIGFSPDGGALIVADWNGKTELWDLASGKLRLTLTDVGAAYTFFSPDGRTLVTWRMRDSLVLLRDAESGRLQGEIDEPSTGSCAFSSNGRLLALPGLHTIVLWDVAARRVRARYARADLILALSPDGDFLALSRPIGLPRPIDLPTWIPDAFRRWMFSQWQAADAWVEILDTNAGETLTFLPDASHAEFLPDGKTLMTYDGESRALWDLPPRTLLPRLYALASHPRCGVLILDLAAS